MPWTVDTGWRARERGGPGVLSQAFCCATTIPRRSYRPACRSFGRGVF